jgi:hypothetical protein
MKPRLLAALAALVVLASVFVVKATPDAQNSPKIATGSTPTEELPSVSSEEPGSGSSQTSTANQAVMVNDCDLTVPNPCLNEVIDLEIQENGIEAGLELMRKVFEVNPEVYAACHSFAHGVGKSAAKHYGIEAFGYATYECQRGYLHGTVQKLSGNYAKIGDMVEAFSKKCVEMYSESRTMMTDCYHGTGQSTVYVDNAAMEEAMDACLGRVPTEDMGVFCVSGLLMEYGDGFLHSADYTSDFTVDVYAAPYTGDVIALCKKISEKYDRPTGLVDECYMRLWMFEGPKYHKANLDYDKMCRDSTGASRHWCYVGIGNWLHRIYFWEQNKSWPPETKAEGDELVEFVVSACERLNDPVTCVEGATVSSSGHLYGVYPEDLIPEYCHAMQQNLQAACEKVRDEIIRMELEHLN